MIDVQGLYRKDDTIYRVLAVKGNSVLVIDCVKLTMEACYASSKSWAVMLAEIAQEVDIDELLRICNMRVVFDKPKIKC